MNRPTDRQVFTCLGNAGAARDEAHAYLIDGSAKVQGRASNASYFAFHQDRQLTVTRLKTTTLVTIRGPVPHDLMIRHGFPQRVASATISGSTTLHNYSRRPRTVTLSAWTDSRSSSRLFVTVSRFFALRESAYTHACCAL